MVVTVEVPARTPRVTPLRRRPLAAKAVSAVATILEAATEVDSAAAARAARQRARRPLQPEVTEDLAAARAPAPLNPKRARIAGEAARAPPASPRPPAPPPATRSCSRKETPVSLWRDARGCVSSHPPQLYYYYSFLFLFSIENFATSLLNSFTCHENSCVHSFYTNLLAVLN